MKGAGMLLLAVGCLLAVIGLVLFLVPRVPWLGNLPGDIHIQGKGRSFHFPIVTCLIASVALTLVVNVLVRLFR